ncbi:predicted protein [Postia placenta Mad-698-R]|nr:predicted protein [Postia placenta Mad-698-R]
MFDSDAQSTGVSALMKQKRTSGLPRGGWSPRRRVLSSRLDGCAPGLLVAQSDLGEGSAHTCWDRVVISPAGGDSGATRNRRVTYAGEHVSRPPSASVSFLDRRFSAVRSHARPGNLAMGRIATIHKCESACARLSRTRAVHAVGARRERCAARFPAVALRSAPRPETASRRRALRTPSPLIPSFDHVRSRVRPGNVPMAHIGTTPGCWHAATSVVRAPFTLSVPSRSDATCIGALSCVIARPVPRLAAAHNDQTEQSLSLDLNALGESVGRVRESTSCALCLCPRLSWTGGSVRCGATVSAWGDIQTTRDTPGVHRVLRSQYPVSADRLFCIACGLPFRSSFDTVRTERATVANSNMPHCSSALRRDPHDVRQSMLDSGVARDVPGSPGAASVGRRIAYSTWAHTTRLQPAESTRDRGGRVETMLKRPRMLSHHILPQAVTSASRADVREAIGTPEPPASVQIARTRALEMLRWLILPQHRDAGMCERLSRMGIIVGRDPCLYFEAVDGTSSNVLVQLHTDRTHGGAAACMIAVICATVFDQPVPIVIQSRWRHRKACGQARGCLLDNARWHTRTVFGGRTQWSPTILDFSLASEVDWQEQHVDPVHTTSRTVNPFTRSHSIKNHILCSSTLPMRDLIGMHNATLSSSCSDRPAQLVSLSALALGAFGNIETRV